MHTREEYYSKVIPFVREVVKQVLRTVRNPKEVTVQFPTELGEYIQQYFFYQGYSGAMLRGGHRDFPSGFFPNGVSSIPYSPTNDVYVYWDLWQRYPNCKNTSFKLCLNTGEVTIIN